jgi:hypothetical protein
MPEFVAKEVCEIKHREVEEMKDELSKLRDCITSKFSRLNALMFSVLSALVVNLVIMLVRK